MLNFRRSDGHARPGHPLCLHAEEKQAEASSLNEEDFAYLGKACVVVEKRQCEKGKPCETYLEPERRRRLAQTKKEKKEENRKKKNKKNRCQRVRWQYFFRVEPGAAALAGLDASALLRSERKHGCKGEKYVQRHRRLLGAARAPADEWRCARPECVKLVDPSEDIKKLEMEIGTAAANAITSMICGFVFAWWCWLLFQYWFYAPERHFRDGPHGWQGHATFIPCVGFLKRPNYGRRVPDPPPALVQLAPSPHPKPYVAQAPVVVLEAPPRVLRVAIPPGAAPGAVIHATAPTGERVAVTVPPTRPPARSSSSPPPVTEERPEASMFKKRERKGSKRAREEPAAASADEPAHATIVAKERKQTRGAHFGTRGDDDGDSDDDDRMQGAADFDTDKDQDARALLRRKFELQEAGATNDETGLYQGQAGYKSYVKLNEAQIGANKYTGTKGTIRAPSFVRNTCRFDYQPDVCKDYKDTGFCGSGDFVQVHARDAGDYKTGWQLEAEYQRQKERDKEREMLGKLGEPDSDDEREANKFAWRGRRAALRVPPVPRALQGPHDDDLRPLLLRVVRVVPLPREEHALPHLREADLRHAQRRAEAPAKAKAAGGFDALFQKSLVVDEEEDVDDYKGAGDYGAPDQAPGAARPTPESRRAQPPGSWRPSTRGTCNAQPGPAASISARSRARSPSAPSSASRRSFMPNFSISWRATAVLPPVVRRRVRDA
ncbi:snoRNA splicing protein [Aureococcus anophagefferens]|uniref:SnoRNA splicing protein n=1 Tax=Aureococcus anophagefferens TaxID=44056 RepID=A0ABR1G437_AURAN